MKTIISEVQKMLTASRTSLSKDVAVAIIKHSMSQYRGMSYSDIKTENESSTFTLSYKKIDAVPVLLNQASDIAQQAGCLLTAMCDGDDVNITVCPISESDVETISILGNMDLDMYGELHIEFPAQYDDCTLLNVVGEFASGTLFDVFVEELEDHVIDSSYHYSHECYDDIVTIAIYSDEAA